MKLIKVLFLAIGCLIFVGCQKSMEDRVAEECKEYTKKQCPSQIVANTRMDSMVYESDSRTIRYYYSLFNDADNKDRVEATKELLSQALHAGVKADVASKQYKEAGFNFRFTYHSGKDPKTILFDQTFKKGDY